ncbi:hypothetical protein [Limnobacter sp.]|uniref:hypothetical protein n=1 Tax=Limnobacter sp. TaxID=2003368 RepID=UPI0025C22DD1|nr:hypothetical protein [Limnobacter sp.]
MKITEQQAIEIFTKLVDQAVGNGHAKGVSGTMIISPESIDETVENLIENDPILETYARDAGVDIKDMDLQSELSQHAHFQYYQCVAEAKRQFESITSSCNIILGGDEEIYVEKNQAGDLVITNVDLCGHASGFPKPSLGEKLTDYYKRCTK